MRKWKSSKHAPPSRYLRAMMAVPGPATGWALVANGIVYLGLYGLWRLQYGGSQTLSTPYSRASNATPRSMTCIWGQGLGARTRSGRQALPTHRD